jgi:hypothetical protein
LQAFDERGINSGSPSQERRMSVTVEERKKEFLTALDETRAHSEAALAGIDSDRMIYPESGWRVKDLIAHIAAWEAEVVNSLYAYGRGKEYSILGFTTDEAYNAVISERNRNTPIDDIRAQWTIARFRLKAAIQAISSERFDGLVMCPWKKYSGIDGIVRDMVNHENEHIHDILAKGN